MKRNKNIFTWIKSLLLVSGFCGLLSVGSLLHDYTKTQKVSASYYYETLDTIHNDFSVFGSVNSINQSYFEDLPSWNEDDSVYHWGSLGDYYIKVTNLYDNGNTYTQVNLQYKLNSVFLIHNDDSVLYILDDVYTFTSSYLNVGTDDRVALNKQIVSITLRQDALYVYDSSSVDNHIDLGLQLFFNFSDNSNYLTNFNTLTYSLNSNEGYEYEDTDTYLMDFLNISQTMTIVNNSNVADTESSYNQGYEIGYNNGYEDGRESASDDLTSSYNDGYNAGYQDGYNSDSVVSTIFSGIIQIALVPVNFFLGVFNFEILGINLRAFIQALFTIAITIIIIKMFVGGKGGDSSD